MLKCVDFYFQGCNLIILTIIFYDFLRNLIIHRSIYLFFNYFFKLDLLRIWRILLLWYNWLPFYLLVGKLFPGLNASLRRV